MDTSLPKTDTFRFRINPETRRKIEEIYERNGLTLTQAINIFIKQSINSGGLPFNVTDENSEILKQAALKKLIKQLENGKNSGELISEEDAYKALGVEL